MMYIFHNLKVFFKNSFSLFLLTYSIISWADFPQSCPRMSLANNCSFYDKCLEARNQCGLDGYTLNYGLKFCKKFNAMDLSSEGEKWITKTMACLQANLIQFAETKTDCNVIEQKAFETHVSCYIESGFCNLNASDLGVIAKTNFWAIISYQGAIQGLDILKVCVLDKQ